MVQSEIVNRIFRILVGNQLGTVFTVDRNDCQYLITAKHLFKELSFPAEASVKILMSGGYNTFCVDVRYDDNPDVDIAVMKIKPYKEISPRYSNSNTTEGMIYGQDVYFLGFPLNYDELVGNFPNSEKPMPFVKKACLSGFQSDNSVIFLDGINNPGFSGGPACYKTSSDRLYRIAGVVCSYRWNKSILCDVDNNETDYYIKENTGIIHVYNIDFALRIIDEWN